MFSSLIRLVSKKRTRRLLVNRSNKIYRPKLRGWLYYFIVRTRILSFLLIVIICYFSIATIFATIYQKIDLIGTNSYIDNLYFSLITQTTVGYGEINPQKHFRFAKLIPGIQAFIGTFYISIFIAVMIYKLINIPENVVRIEDTAVFYPKDRTLRIRAISLFSLRLLRVDVSLTLRTLLPEQTRFATFDVFMKRQTIPVMIPRVPWFLATEPFEVAEDKQELVDLDPKRKIRFHPEYIKREMVPASSNDPTLLRLELHAIVPVFGTALCVERIFSYDQILCGMHRRVYPKPQISRWRNWARMVESSPRRCSSCEFNERCGLSTHKKNTM